MKRFSTTAKVQITISLLCLFSLQMFAASAYGFHFTITGDMRDQHETFGLILESINNIVGGPGAFHVSPGDLDPLQPNRDKIDYYFGSDFHWYPLIGNHDCDGGSELDIQWLRNEYDNANGSTNRPPLKDITYDNGRGVA